jgi:glutamate formiminotransferase / 5-formyltetrahydrofolate cyclo-ligase
MERIVECVPNFSEGRKGETVDALVAAAEREGAVLLDREMDASHNRCVLTFAGPPDVVGRAAFACVREAIPRIDLNRHRGEHPRMGACDVVPFVPVAGVSIDEAVSLARDVGRRIGEELGVPVYLYAEAATRPERRALPDIRKGEFEGLRERIGRDPAAAPDFGPSRIHPTAGATAVGARFFLIAYNVHLDTPDVELAKAIAREVRERDGGLPRVQAKGFEVEAAGRKLAQVSMNLLDFRQTSILRAFEEVEKRAASRGVALVDSELVGLVPSAALDDVTARRVRLRGYDPARQVLENVIEARRRPS